MKYMHLDNGDFNIPFDADVLEWELDTGTKYALVTNRKITVKEEDAFDAFQELLSKHTK